MKDVIIESPLSKILLLGLLFSSMIYAKYPKASSIFKYAKEVPKSNLEAKIPINLKHSTNSVTISTLSIRGINS